MTQRPDTRSAYFTAMKPAWDQVSALMGGTRAMRLAGENYLPRHEAESLTTYTNRLNQTTLFNVFRSSVRHMTAQAFAKPATLAEGAPSEFAAMAEDIDQEGSSLSQFLRAAFESTLPRGEGYILVDVDPAGEGERTIADQRRAGRRPYWVFIPAGAMLQLVIERVGGREVVSRARWLDASYEPAEEGFGETHVTRVREYSRDGWKVWRHERKVEEHNPARNQGAETGGRWDLEDEGENPFTYEGERVVPIVPVRLTGLEEDGLRVPPLQDLADKNVEHWQSSSDQRAILTFARFPMLSGSGVDPDDLEKTQDGKVAIGPQAFLFSRDPQGKFGYVEPSGAAIKAGSDDLNRLVEEMASLAAQPYMTKQSGDVTATRTALEHGKSHSLLESYVETLRDCAEQAARYTGAWMNRDFSGVGIEIDPQFSATGIDAAKVTALLNARQNGDLSREAFLSELQAIGVLSEMFAFEVNSAQLEAEMGASLEDDLNDAAA